MKSYLNRKKGFGMVYDDIYLVNGSRTAFGKYCGTLAQVSPTDLGIIASRAALDKSGVRPDDIDQVVTANIGQSSYDAYFLPRHISLYSGIPKEVPSIMVQRICGSGLETVIMSADQITLGKAETALCCGTENMTLSPTASFGNRLGYTLGRPVFKDMLWEALDDTAIGSPMGFTAETVAKKYGITRADVDEFAKLSFDRALAARERKFFDEEIVPVSSTVLEADLSDGSFEEDHSPFEGSQGDVLTKMKLKSRKVSLPRGVSGFSTDENVRPTTMELLSKLPLVFSNVGVLTAGNSSGIVDGAAAVVVAHKKSVDEKSLKPIAKVLAAASCGVDPNLMGLGPVPAIELLLEMTGLRLSDIGLIEINEAFAAQFIGCERELDLDRSICNVNGGAIAIGHPLAATGTRLSLTIAREMNQRKVKYGIASACIGGGQGTAILFENTNM